MGDPNNISMSVEIKGVIDSLVAAFKNVGDSISGVVKQVQVANNQMSESQAKATRAVQDSVAKQIESIKRLAAEKQKALDETDYGEFESDREVDRAAGAAKEQAEILKVQEEGNHKLIMVNEEFRRALEAQDRAGLTRRVAEQKKGIAELAELTGGSKNAQLTAGLDASLALEQAMYDQRVADIKEHYAKTLAVTVAGMTAANASIDDINQKKLALEKQMNDELATEAKASGEKQLQIETRFADQRVLNTAKDAARELMEKSRDAKQLNQKLLALEYERQAELEKLHARFDTSAGENITMATVEAEIAAVNRQYDARRKLAEDDSLKKLYLEEARVAGAEREKMVAIEQKYLAKRIELENKLKELDDAHGGNVDDLRTRYTNLIGTLGKAEAAEKRFAQLTGLREASEQLNQFALDLAQIGTAALAGFTAIIKPAAELQKALATVQAVSKASADDMDRLGKKALEVGMNSLYSAKQVAEGMKFLAQSGFDVPEINTMTEDIKNLAQAADMDLSAAFEIAANTIRAFNLEAKDMAAISDVLAGTANKTNVDVKDLAESFKYAGPVAAAAGMSFAETAAVLGIMGNAGIKASMGGTAVRQSISALLAPTKQQQKMMDELGLSLKDANGKFIGIAAAIDQLTIAFEGMAVADKAGKSMKLFGDRAGPGMLALIEQGGGAIRKLTEEVKKDGEAAKTAAQRMDNYIDQSRRLGNSLQTLGTIVAGNLLGPMTQLTSILADTVKWFANLMQEWPKLTAALGYFAGVVGTVGAVTLGISGLMKAVALLTGMFAQSALQSGILSTAMASLGTVANATKVSFLGQLTALQALPAALMAATRYSYATGGAMQALAMLVSGAATAIRTSLTLIVTALPVIGMALAGFALIAPILEKINDLVMKNKVERQNEAELKAQIDKTAQAYNNLKEKMTDYYLEKQRLEKMRQGPQQVDAGRIQEENTPEGIHRRILALNEETEAIRDQLVALRQNTEERLKAAQGDPAKAKEILSQWNQELASIKARNAALADAKKAAYDSLQIMIETEKTAIRTEKSRRIPSLTGQAMIQYHQKNLDILTKTQQVVEQTAKFNINDFKFAKALGMAAEEADILDYILGNTKEKIKSFNLSELLSQIEEQSRVTAALGKTEEDVAKARETEAARFRQSQIDQAAMTIEFARKSLAEIEKVSKEKIEILKKEQAELDKLNEFGTPSTESQAKAEEIRKLEEQVAEARIAVRTQTMEAMAKLEKDAVAGAIKANQDMNTALKDLAKERAEIFEMANLPLVSDKIKTEEQQLQDSLDRMAALWAEYVRKRDEGDLAGATETFKKYTAMVKDGVKEIGEIYADLYKQRADLAKEIAEMEENFAKKAARDKQNTSVTPVTAQDIKSDDAAKMAESYAATVRSAYELAKVNGDITAEKREQLAFQRSRQLLNQMIISGDTAGLAVELARAETHAKEMRAKQEDLRAEAEARRRINEEEKIDRINLEKKKAQYNDIVKILDTDMTAAGKAAREAFERSKTIDAMTPAERIAEELRMAAKLGVERKKQADEQEARAKVQEELARVSYETQLAHVKILIGMYKVLLAILAEAMPEAAKEISKNFNPNNLFEGISAEKMLNITAKVTGADVLTQGLLDGKALTSKAEIDAYLKKNPGAQYLIDSLQNNKPILLKYTLEGNADPMSREVTVTVKELHELKKIYGARGVNFKISSTGLSELPSDIIETLRAVRKDAEIKVPVSIQPPPKSDAEAVKKDVAQVSKEGQEAATFKASLEAMTPAEKAAAIADTLKMGEEAKAAYIKAYVATTPAQTAAVQESGREVGTTVASKVTKLVQQEDPIGSGISNAMPASITALNTVLTRMKAVLDDWVANLNLVIKVKIKTVGGGDLPAGVDLPGKALGGPIGSGYGGGDRIPILAESGEFMIRKEAVRGWGLDLLHFMNTRFSGAVRIPAMKMGMPAMASGGPVNGLKNLGTYTLNLKVGRDTESFPLMGEEAVIRRLQQRLAREELTTTS